MKLTALTIGISAVLLTSGAFAHDHGNKGKMVSDDVIAEQRANLAKNTAGKGFGPQSPRDLNTAKGNNIIAFNMAPAHTELNLCNIHFHKNAEHAGGEFTTYAGNGNGKGFETGFVYDGKLAKSELMPVEGEICPAKTGGLFPGDTIEVHYVHSSANIQPGPTLGACLSESIMNPSLRVEGQVFVLVNDDNALDFNDLATHSVINGKHQAPNIPSDTGTPIQYTGSTTGPSYNEKGSPLQVSWSVRPQVAKVSIKSVGKWCEGNTFNEDHAHGVRNLVTNPDLISDIL